MGIIVFRKIGHCRVITFTGINGIKWHELYTKENEPRWENIENYVYSPLWDDLCGFIEKTWLVFPKVEYSCCSAQKGWNVKYKKGDKSLCTLCPMNGYFIALVVIGKKEEAGAELVLPACSGDTQNVFRRTPFSPGGRWLMLEVRDSAVLADVKLIRLRVTSNNGSEA